MKRARGRPALTEGEGGMMRVARVGGGRRDGRTDAGEARGPDCFPGRLDRNRKGDGGLGDGVGRGEGEGCRSRRWWRRRAIPVQLSLADRCICQNVADVSGSFHVATTCCYYRTFLFSAVPRPLAASIRNAATRCNPL